MLHNRFKAMRTSLLLTCTMTWVTGTPLAVGEPEKYKTNAEHLHSNETESVHEASEIAEEAFLHGFPLVAMMRTREVMLAESGPCHGPENQLNGSLVKKNNVFQGSAWLDLTKEPIVLKLKKDAPIPSRVRILDAYTDVVENVTPEQLQKGVLIAKSDVADSNDLKVIDSPTPQLWLQVEWLKVGNELGVAEAEEWLQVMKGSTYSRFGEDNIRLVQLVMRDERPKVDELLTMGITFFDEMGVALKSNPLPEADTEAGSKFAALGIGVDLKPSLSSEREIRDALALGLKRGQKRLLNGDSENSSRLLQRAAKAFALLNDKPDDRCFNWPAPAP